MKRWLLLIALTAGIFAGGMAYGATYDATGEWFVQTLPGQSIVVDIPVAGIHTTITQDGDTFTFTTEPVAELGDIPYVGAGIVNAYIYTFDPPLQESFNFQDYDPMLSDFDADVALGGFTLLSATQLEGFFDVSITYKTLPFEQGVINFEGTKNVPVPGAIWLLGSGVLCLAGWRRNSRNLCH